MPSCLRLTPGLDELVIARVPAPAAPYTMLIAATSDSAWTNTPPTSGILTDIYSGTSFCGVIGYPKKARHPLRMAPSQIASVPCSKILDINLLLTSAAPPGRGMGSFQAEDYFSTSIAQSGHMMAQKAQPMQFCGLSASATK